MDFSDGISGVHQFFDYVTDTWIDSDNVYPKISWNYYNFHSLRTNHSLESWHYRLNTNIGSSSPNFFLVLKELRKDYAFNIATIKQVEHQEMRTNHRVENILLEINGSLT